MTEGIQELRAAFPALDDGLCYLDWGATGLLPESTRERLAAWALAQARCPEADSGRLHLEGGVFRDGVRERIAARLGRASEDIALVESTTAGLHRAVEAVSLRPGDNVVLLASDYAAVAQPFKRRAEREGLEIRWIPPEPDGTLDPAAFLAAFDERTRMTALSTLAWTTGALLPLEEIVPEARRRGVTSLVDAIQTFGVMPLPEAARAATFVTGGGHKWLCSPLGAGFLAVEPDFARAHQPPDVGFLAAEPPGGDWGRWFSDPEASARTPLPPRPVGASFETGGTPSYVGALGLVASLELLDGVAPDRLLAHVRALGDALIEGLDRRGLRVVSPRAAERRAGLVVFGLPGGVEAERALAARAREERVVLSVRYSHGLGGLRVALHGMNTADDVERLLELVTRGTR